MSNISHKTLEKLRFALEAKADPVYAPLLELIVEKCPGQLTLDAGNLPCIDGHLVRETITGPTPFKSFHSACNGTGFVTRSGYWKDAPDGAFAGALLAAIRKMPDTTWKGIHSNWWPKILDYSLFPSDRGAARAVLDMITRVPQ